VEDAVHGLARFGVHGHTRADDDRVRAEKPGPPAAHRGPDPIRLGLVTRCEYDAGADDDGASAQPGIVALLHRRVERVEVGMEDRRLAGHEHMFSYKDGSNTPCLQAGRALRSVSIERKERRRCRRFRNRALRRSTTTALRRTGTRTSTDTRSASSRFA